MARSAAPFPSNNTSKLRENLLARLDRAPITRTIKIIIIVLMLCWLVDAFDIGIIASGFLFLKPAWHLTPAQMGLLASSGTFGIVLGLLPAGRLSDLYGRKRVLIVGIVLFSLFTAGSMLAQNVQQLTALRFLAGLGEGAVFPVPYLMISEFVNKSRRGEAVGWANFVLTTAYMVPNLVGVFISHAGLGDSAWRILFGLGALPILITPLVSAFLPESPRFLLETGRADAVREFVERIEDEAGLAHDTGLSNRAAHTLVQLSSPGASRASMLLGSPYLLRSFVAFCALGSPFVIFYSTTLYGPTIFHLMGATPANSLLYVAGLQFLAGIGTIVVSATGDRVGRRPTIFVCMAISAIALFLLGRNLPTPALVLTAMTAWFFGVGNFAVPKLYMAEQFPAQLRATGSAIGEFITRILFGVVLAYFVPSLLAAHGISAVFAGLAGLMVVLVLPILFLGTETAGRSIEETGSTAEAPVVPISTPGNAG